jgi:uncharacterized protein (DUF305 family)
VKTVTKMATRLTRLGRQRAVSLLLVILMVSLNGAQGHSKHSVGASHGAAGSQAWSSLQQSMLAMHSAMSSVHSTGNDDEDFVGLMLPHHQAALDMARVELTHGRDPQMRRLAQEIIADQESEIELMKLWLSQKEAGKLPTSAAKDQ